MVKKVSIIALVTCLIGFGSAVFAQDVNKLPNPIKTDKEVSKVKDNKLPPNMKMFKPFGFNVGLRPRTPSKIKNALELLKFADELQLTDDQLIQLRNYYKKYYSEEAKKKEMVKIPSVAELYAMNEQELQKYAEDESARIKKGIMLKIQKIIEIKRILTSEQIQKIKEDSEKEAERAKKKLEEKLALNNKSATKIKHPKPNKCRCYKMMGMKPFLGMPHMQPMFPHQSMMQPPMQPMFPPQGCPNMMPHKQPMLPPQGMMQPPMQPMFPPQGCPNMMPPMQPMFPPQGMMQPMFPHQGCPCMMSHKKTMGPKHHKFHNDKNMNNPCMSCPPFMGWKDRPKMEPPFAGFLSKFFGCKNDKDSDIMRKDRKVDGDKKVPQKGI